MDRFAECFSSLVDPRKNQAQHDLTEMLFIALLATLCGATTCCDVALFGRAKEALLRTILVLEHGIPSHDTFSRVFRILDPRSFEEVFRRFTKAFATAGPASCDKRGWQRRRPVAAPDYSSTAGAPITNKVAGFGSLSRQTVLHSGCTHAPALNGVWK